MSKTPVRAGLKEESDLHNKVHGGLGALKKVDKGYIEDKIRQDFGDSIDIDAAFLAGHESGNRWDYLLGHTPSEAIVGLEPHTAGDGEVSTVIKKRKRSLEHLRAHMRDGVRVVDWYWVASGKVDFTAHDKTQRQLDNAGVTFVGKQLLPKHLAALVPKRPPRG
jgi:hypothetical protein